MKNEIHNDLETTAIGRMIRNRNAQHGVVLLLPSALARNINVLETDERWRSGGNGTIVEKRSVRLYPRIYSS